MVHIYSIPLLLFYSYKQVLIPLQILSALHIEFNWSQTVSDPDLFIPLSCSSGLLLVLANVKSVLCAQLTQLHEALL